MKLLKIMIQAPVFDTVWQAFEKILTYNKYIKCFIFLTIMFVAPSCTSDAPLEDEFEEIKDNKKTSTKKKNAGNVDSKTREIKKDLNKKYPDVINTDSKNIKNTNAKLEIEYKIMTNKEGDPYIEGNLLSSDGKFITLPVSIQGKDGVKSNIVPYYRSEKELDRAKPCKIHKSDAPGVDNDRKNLPPTLPSFNSNLIKKQDKLNSENILKIVILQLIKNLYLKNSCHDRNILKDNEEEKNKETKENCENLKQENKINEEAKPSSNSLMDSLKQPNHQPTIYIKRKNPMKTNFNEKEHIYPSFVLNNNRSNIGNNIENIDNNNGITDNFYIPPPQTNYTAPNATNRNDPLENNVAQNNEYANRTNNIPPYIIDNTCNIPLPFKDTENDKYPNDDSWYPQLSNYRVDNIPCYSKNKSNTSDPYGCNNMQPVFYNNMGQIPNKTDSQTEDNDINKDIDLNMDIDEGPCMGEDIISSSLKNTSNGGEHTKSDNDIISEDDLLSDIDIYALNKNIENDNKNRKSMSNKFTDLFKKKKANIPNPDDLTMVEV